MKKKYNNTLQKGSVRYIVFREGQFWYAAGLEFNIVEAGDTPQEAFLLLLDAISGYVDSAKKIKARPNILNQKTDSEYEKMWENIQGRKLAQTKNVYTSGEFNFNKALQRSLIPA